MSRMKLNLGALFFGLALLAGMVAAAVQPDVARAQTGERCFSETGFCISGEIRNFWERNGGLAVFGLPLGPQQAALGEDGVARQTQWFERHRLELHPENPAPYNVLLGRLGVDRLAQQGRDWRAFPSLDPNAADAERCRFFRETNQQVCAEFLTAFRSYGLNFDGRAAISFEESLALFGLPISGPLTEMIEGKEYTVQWFERARFELHPENQPPFNVLFGRLGAEVQGGGATTALTSRSWQLVSFGAASAPEAAASERPATLNFDGERAFGFSGCNNFSGTYQAGAATITFGPLISTLAACSENKLTRQEQAIFAVLQGQASYSLSGDELRITSGNQALTYRAGLPSDPLAALRATTWRLEGFGMSGSPDPAALRGQRPILVFEAERVAGNTGCNGFGGAYQANAETITFGPLISTLIACSEEPLTRQEQAIFAVLQGEVSYRIQDGQLSLTRGDQRLIYRAAAANAVTGTVSYLPRIALPPEAVIEVQLVDVSRADAPALVIATQTIVAGGRQVPFAFELPYDPAQIDERYSYAVQARITVNDQLRFITTERFSVITRGNPTQDVEVLVRPV
jgi:heat shock protein HslJ/uncharacterized lipoprotein YbaY